MSNGISINFFALGESLSSVGRNALTLDQVEKTIHHFSKHPTDHLGHAIGAMLGGELSEEELSRQYGTNRTNLVLDMTVTICARLVDFDHSHQLGNRNIVMGLTSLRTRDKYTNELGYLTIVHGIFTANTLGFDPEKMEFPDSAWVSWLSNHSEDAIAMYHENSKAHLYLQSSLSLL